MTVEKTYILSNQLKLLKKCVGAHFGIRYKIEPSFCHQDIIWNTDILEKRSSKTEGKKSQNLAATAFHTILNFFPFSVPNLELKEYDPVLEL